MKEFDWERLEKNSTRRRYEWYATNFDKVVPPERYVRELRLIFEMDKNDGLLVHLKKDQRREMRRGRTLMKNYGFLRENYKFFTGKYGS